MKKISFFKTLMSLGAIILFGIFVSSCDKEDDTPAAPSIKIQINSIDGFTVDIAAQASADVVSWHWDYGDGQTSDSVGGHYHTYEKGGDYTITCTVKNEAGVSASATTDVHVTTLADLLTAHPWVMANSGNNGIGFHITPELTTTIPVINVLSTLNSFIDPDNDTPYDFTAEYTDSYTFNADGSYEVDYGNNSNILASWVYSLTAEPNSIVGTCKYVGIFALQQQPLEGAKWAFHEGEDLTLNTIYDPDQSGTGDDAQQETVTFQNVNYITFENGGFLGIKDYTTTVILRSIEADKMEITYFFHGYLNEDHSLGINEPSFFLNLTFVTKK
jgi:PKD repeat protein